jgi:hypothetical protein
VLKTGENLKNYPGYALQSPEGETHAGGIIATSQMEQD